MPKILIASLMYYAFVLIAGIAAFIYLFMWNWQVALAIFLVLWMNNLGDIKKD